MPLQLQPPGGPSKIRITTKVSVDAIEDFTAIPSVWSVPPPGSSIAYRLKLPKTDPRLEDMKLAKIICHETRDSWQQVSGGALGGDTWIEAGVLDPADRVWVRRATATCGGIKICSEGEYPWREGHERYEPDWSLTQSLWDEQLAASSEEWQINNATSVYVLARRHYPMTES